MSFSKPFYVDLPDISGSSDHGPKVLKSVLDYQPGAQLKWDTREACITLAKSEELYSESNKSNTLLCIQSIVLPSLTKKKRLDLLACFLHCVDGGVRKETITNLERTLLNIEHFAETFELLHDTENVLFEVLQFYLKHWRVLSKENEQFFLSIVSLYCMVIGAVADGTLSSDNHIRFEELILNIKTRDLLSINKRKHKGLVPLQEPLKQLRQHLKLKLKCYQKIHTATSAESVETLKLPKESPEIQFTVVYFVLQKLFENPTPERLHTFKKCVGSVLQPSTSQKPLLVNLVTHGIVNFLLQYLVEGKLKSRNVIGFSEEMITLLPTKTVTNLGAIDVLMFVKNAPARSQMIGIFSGHDLYDYDNDIIKTSMKIIETLLAATTPQFKSPEHHPYTKEWRQCAGKFGKRPVLLNVYIPNRKTHEQDIYVTDDRLKGQEPFNEISLLQILPPHPNLIQVFAFSLSKLPYFYITENHLHGNLQMELKNKSINMDTFSLKRLLTFVVDAISALEFLHCNKIVHRDLTAASFCLNEERNHVKLANLCLANRQDSSERMQRGKSSFVPTRWLAPESFTDLIFSTASDVWMFGCLMYEILTHGCLPHSDIIAGDGKILDLIRERRKNLCQENCISADLFKIITECSIHDPDNRPESTHLKQQLKDVLCSTGEEHFAAGTAFPSLWSERIPSAEMKRGLSFDEKEASGYEAVLYQSFQGAEASGSSDSNDDYEGLVYERGARVFPLKEVISSDASPAHVFELQKLNLQGIPSFTVDRKGKGDVILYDQMEEATPFISSQEIRPRYEMLWTLCIVAQTISQLHDENWIHGDVTTENIWSVHGYDTPKIIFSGIQFMVHLKSSEHSVRVRRDVSDIDKRSAPELKKNGKLSKACDVFSFGFVIWDVATAIYDGKMMSSLAMLPTEEEDLYSHYVTARGNEILPSPEKCPSQLYIIMKDCWHSDPSKRPIISQVAKNISDFMEIIEKPDFDRANPDEEDDSGYEFMPRMEEYKNYCSSDEITNDYELCDNGGSMEAVPKSLANTPKLYENVPERSPECPPLPPKPRLPKPPKPRQAAQPERTTDEPPPVPARNY